MGRCRSRQSANNLAAGAGGGDDRLKRAQSRVTDDRDVADDERGRGDQAQRASEIDQVLHCAGDVIAVAKRNQAGLVEAETVGDLKRARSVNLAALRIDVAVKIIKLLRRAQLG